VIPSSVGGGAAPGPVPVHSGAACVHFALVSEGEHALAAGGGAGCQAETLTGTRAGDAISPPVGDHVVGRVHCSGAPGRGRASICALVILNTFVLEWEHTLLSLFCQTRVRDSLL